MTSRVDRPMAVGPNPHPVFGRAEDGRVWNMPPVNPIVLALVSALHDIERMRASRTMLNVDRPKA